MHGSPIRCNRPPNLAGIDVQTRKRLGAWYTPPALVDHVLDAVLDPVLAARDTAAGLHILDPACGDGRFLAAAAERIRCRFGSVPAGSLTGVDIDAGAVATATALLGPAGDVRHGDALDGAVPSEPFDVVIGNPPFLNQLAAGTSRGGRSPWGGGAYADTAALFLSLALHAARPDGGRIGLVLPHSILATRDTAPIRTAVLADARLDSLWWAGEAVFDADVVTCVATFVRGGAQHGIRRSHGPGFEPLPDADGADLARRPTWSHLCADAAGIPLVALGEGPSLRHLATATADFRDQYYGLVPHVADRADGAPLVTAGLLDAGRCAWGERPARFARRTFTAPRVAVGDLPEALRAWAAGRLVPKVLVATQTRVIEAAVDATGQWLPSVPVITVAPRDGADLWRIGAVLCAPATTAWAAATYLGAALSARAIKLSASQVLEAPLPARPWDDAADALAGGNVEECARRMDVAYGTDLYDWWQARRASRRS
jgi:SAM-dependent methyltransferase